MTTRQRVAEVAMLPPQEYIRLNWRVGNHAEILADILARFAGRRRKIFGDEGVVRCAAFLRHIGMRTTRIPHRFRQATAAGALRRMVLSTMGTKATGSIVGEHDGMLTIGFTHRAHRGTVVMQITPKSSECSMRFHRVPEEVQISMLCAAFQHLVQVPGYLGMGLRVGEIATQLGKHHGSAP